MEFAMRKSGGVIVRAARLALSGEEAPEAPTFGRDARAACGHRAAGAGASLETVQARAAESSPEPVADPGLASSPGTACAAAYDGLLAFLSADRGRYRAKRLASLVSYVLGDRATVGSPTGFIYVFARSLGYDIPPYPLAGSGEIREFFRDEGVANVPEWYATLGIEGDDYERLHERTAVVVRGLSGVRTLYVLDGVLFTHDKAFSRFATIEESGIARNLDEQRLSRLLA